MDALTWFKSVVEGARTTPAPDVPLHVAAARLRPPAVPALPAGGDDDWDAVIARAKLEAAASSKTPAPRTPPLPRHAPAKAPNPPPPRPPRYGWAEMPTPPPVPARHRARGPEATQATLDTLVSRGPGRLTASGTMKR